MDRIAAACARVGRDLAGVELVAVTKSVPVERVRAAMSAGMSTFGENRVQEAQPKVADVPDATWHLVGHLQSNKTGKAASLFDVIESVDSVDLAVRLGSAARRSRDDQPLPVYLQVNVDRDPAKGGFSAEALERDLPSLVAVDGLDIRGLMTVGRLFESAEAARSTFRRLRSLGERLRLGEPRLGPGLSMGMSDDYEVAVEEGATIVRVGRALFGERILR